METTQYIWHAEKLPAGQQFARVHAVLVTADGRCLLRYKNGGPRVTGGHIDPEDADAEAALKREVREEIDCEVDRCDYLGYIEAIDSAAGTHEFWARMVARVARILPAQPDPDRSNNWIYGRILVPWSQAEQAMDGVFPTNTEVLAAAWKVANEKGYFTEAPSQEVEVVNEESRDS